MSNSVQLPEFEEIQELFALANISVSVSEAHGVMCGMIAATETLQLPDWLAIVCNQEEGPVALQTSEELILKRFIKATRSQIESEEHTFAMMLPDDDCDINKRTAALGEWCHGFVAGLGVSGCYINEHADNQSSEALRDICEISKVSADMAGTEEEEKAFFEVQEYVRVAVMLIYRSLCYDKFATEGEPELLH